MEQYVIRESYTLREAMESFEENHERVILVENEKGKLIGTVSQGDIIRALVAGINLYAQVKQIVKRIAARVGVAAVYVDYITYGAECKERDARREQHVDGVDMGGEEVVDGGDEQAEIFEIGQ